MCCNIVRLCGILVMKLLGCEHTYVSLEGSTGEFMLGNMGDRVGELCLRCVVCLSGVMYVLWCPSIVGGASGSICGCC